MMTKIQRFFIVLLVLLAPLSVAYAEAPVEVADASPDALLKAGPQSPTAEQLIAELDQTYPVRFSVRLEPMRAVGLHTMLMSVMPADAKQKYDDFAQKTKFDAMTQVAGGILVADAPNVGELDSATYALAAIKIKGKVDDALIDYLVNYDSNKEDEEDDNKVFNFAVLVDMSPGQVSRLADSMEKDGLEDGVKIKRVNHDAGHVMMHGLNDKKKSMGCVYIWTGGLIVGQAPNAGAKAKDADAAALCAKTLGIIDRAAKGSPAASIPVMSAATPIPEGVVDIKLDIGAVTSLTAAMDVKGAMLAQVQQFAKMFPMVKAQPDQFIGSMNLPPAFSPLGKLLLLNTTFTVKGDIGTLTLNVSTPDLLKELKSAIQIIKAP